MAPLVHSTAGHIASGVTFLFANFSERFRLALQLAVNRQSVRLGANPFETKDIKIFLQ
jgi:hypothetical protein